MAQRDGWAGAITPLQKGVCVWSIRACSSTGVVDAGTDANAPPDAGTDANAPPDAGSPGAQGDSGPTKATDCGAKECGHNPFGAPNIRCADGTMGGTTCDLQNGTSGWHMRACPTDCGSAPCGTTIGLHEGVWGAQGVSFEVAKGGVSASIHWGCASAPVDQIKVASDGSVTAHGSYLQGSGVPRPDPPPPGILALPYRW